MFPRVSRRTVLKGAVATPLALALPVLGSHGRTAPVAAQDQPEITMWFDTTGGAEVAEAVIKAVVDPYNAKGGPQVKATLQANNWDATRTALAGGAGPDIIGTPGPAYAYELAKAGQLLSLDDVATAQGWDTNLVPWALNLGKVDGKLYSVPDEVETLVLYYNKTVFADKGWTAPKTMAELMTLSGQIKDAGLIPFAHGNQEWRPANEWFVGEFLNRGAGGPAAVYQALTGALPWTDANFADSLTMLDQMQQSGWFMGGLDRYYTTTFADADAAFGDGDAAMKIEGTWWIADGHTYFGEEVIKEILKSKCDMNVDQDVLKKIYEKVYQGLIQEIDGIDNGVPMYDGEPLYRITSDLSARVGHFNAAWNSNEEFDVQGQFNKAMVIVGDEFIDRVLYYTTVWYPGRSIVADSLENRYNVHASGENFSVKDIMSVEGSFIRIGN